VSTGDFEGSTDFEARGIEVEGALARETNWWGAFVVGLAGTVLVIGLIGYSLFALGGTAIILFAVLTSLGVFLCFCLAEMAATWPERAGGLPSYAFETFKPLGKRVATHAGGLSSWGYWLGWFTVAPINAYLAALYVTDLFGINFGGEFGPIDEKFGAVVAVDAFVVAIALLLVMFIPCWLGIRFGATFATFLGIATIVPLVLLVVLPLFKPSTIDFGNLNGLGLPDGTDFSWQLILGWAFIFTWTVLAMEAAACYIGECKEPARDAKIALTAEGLFGLFIYVTLPIMVLAVLGTTGLVALGDDFIGDANVLFNGYVDAIFGASTFWEWLIGLSLISALLLSVLNAIMGASRGLFQNAQDGILPRAFGWVNSHGAPSFAMLFSLVFSIAVLCLGSPLQIYVFSNMGYLFSVALSLVGYGIFRAVRNEVERPLRMPVWMGPVGLAVGVGFLLLWLIGGYYAADYAVGAGYRWLYWIGLVLLALYFPLNWFRQLEDRGAQLPPDELAAEHAKATTP
jgi:amino acid transporter